MIDDEEDIREVIKVGLESIAGWEVITASSGAQGISKAKDDAPDAILMDVMMPEMDGLSTFELLKGIEETKGIPVFLLTARARESDLSSMARTGCRDILTKPFDPLAMPDQIAIAMGWELPETKSEII